jgi:propanediol dehydratase small subunit
MCERSGTNDTIFVRFMERLTGKPHQHHNAERVTDVAPDPREDIHKLSTTLRPYVESDDPLVALMTDVFNRRQLANGKPGAQPS